MRRSILIPFLSLATVGLFIFWPNTAHIDPELPQPGFHGAPKVKNSTITVPIEVNFADLNAVIEAHFPDGEILHEGQKQESRSLRYDYTVKRWGDSSFNIKEGALEITLPLRVDAIARKDFCLGFKKRGKCRGIKTHETGEATAFVDAKALIALLVTEDYSIEVGSNITQQLTNRPHINLGLFGDSVQIRINIEDKVKKLLEKQEGKVTRVLDQLLVRQVDKLDLKATVEKHWHSIRTPITLGDAWIALDPKEIHFKGIHQIHENFMALGFGFSGTTTLSLTKPDAPAPAPLPPVSTYLTDSDFHLEVPLSGAFKDITAQAQRTLIGKTLEKEEYWLKVLDIQLRGATIKNAAGEERGTLAAKIAFEAGRGKPAQQNIEADGALVLTFMPSIDHEHRKLKIVDVEATTETLNLLDAAGVSWLNSKFTPELLSKLNYDYGAQVDIWQQRLNTELKTGVAYQGFTITGHLHEVDLGGFYISGDTLEVYLSAQGKITATVDNLKL